MNYDSIIKRAKKALARAKELCGKSNVHTVTIDDDITKLSGLVVVLNPNKSPSQLAAIEAEKTTTQTKAQEADSD